MNVKDLYGKSSGQLREVLLLLAVAVILPTVCLLWFMSQAVKNERLAVRQKLVTVYKKKLATATGKVYAAWSKSGESVDIGQLGTHSYRTFLSFVDEKGCAGLIIYSAEGKRIYPVLLSDIGDLVGSFTPFGDAWRLEFTEGRFENAAEAYEQKLFSDDDYVHISAIIGKARSLARAGKPDEAVRTCRDAAFFDTADINDVPTLILVSDAQLLLLGLMEHDAQRYESLLEETFGRLLSTVFAAEENATVLPADYRLFVAYKILEVLTEKPLLENGTDSVKARLEKLIVLQERFIRIAERFPTTAALENPQVGVLRSPQTEKETLYSLYQQAGNESILLLFSPANIVSALSDYEDTFKGSDVDYRVLDDHGRAAAGLAQPGGRPFFKMPLGEQFAGWKVELYFKTGGVFEKAAKKQIALYTWAGVLVIVLILGAGVFAGRAVNRQMKLNRLKNDFIATVSHELKTPLASMRVLVDTLLEGNYRDQKQATEYLHLTSKENERLSRLIDNFLTFSRMERNKRAFSIVKVSPAVIARDAAEAVRTKFSEERCEFDVSIDENLSEVLADRDGMVTVLVNLLDNAYKYSCDEKRIVLRVFAEDNLVCFRIVDKGIGMSRRAVKRIFSRFYQVDRTLSRSATGCGLGLSIVKFIVDAHKGKISVESQPGEGSTFTVKVPAAI